MLEMDQMKLDLNRMKHQMKQMKLRIKRTKHRMGRMKLDVRQIKLEMEQMELGMGRTARWVRGMNPRDLVWVHPLQRAETLNSTSSFFEFRFLMGRTWTFQNPSWASMSA